MPQPIIDPTAQLRSPPYKRDSSAAMEMSVSSTGEHRNCILALALACLLLRSDDPAWPLPCTAASDMDLYLVAAVTMEH